jgi:excisionase family DNA binding protein
MDRLLTVRELAERLRVTPTCVYRWLGEHRLPAVRFSKRCVRFRESDVQQLLDRLRNADADSEGNARLQRRGFEQVKPSSRTKTL